MKRITLYNKEGDNLVPFITLDIPDLQPEAIEFDDNTGAANIFIREKNTKSPFFGYYLRGVLWYANKNLLVGFNTSPEYHISKKLLDGIATQKEILDGK